MTEHFGFVHPIVNVRVEQTLCWQ